MLWQSNFLSWLEGFCGNVELERLALHRNLENKISALYPKQEKYD